MSIKNMKTAESRAYWKFVSDVVKEVSKWPQWKRGERQVRAMAAGKAASGTLRATARREQGKQR